MNVYNINRLYKRYVKIDKWLFSCCNMGYMSLFWFSQWGQGIHYYTISQDLLIKQFGLIGRLPFMSHQKFQLQILLFILTPILHSLLTSTKTTRRRQPRKWSFYKKTVKLYCRSLCVSENNKESRRNSKNSKQQINIFESKHNGYWRMLFH